MQCHTGLNVQNRLLLPQINQRPFLTLRPSRHSQSSRRHVREAPKGFLDTLFGDEASSDLHPDGPIFQPIDVESDGGLGGTSDGLFGPLVHAIPDLLYYMVWRFALDIYQIHNARAGCAADRLLPV